MLILNLMPATKDWESHGMLQTTCPKHFTGTQLIGNR